MLNTVCASLETRVFEAIKKEMKLMLCGRISVITKMYVDVFTFYVGRAECPCINSFRIVVVSVVVVVVVNTLVHIIQYHGILVILI